MSTGIKPRHTTAQQFDRQLIFFQVEPVQIRDLKFTTFGWLHLQSFLCYSTVIKVQTSNCIARLRLLRFFFDGDHTTLFIKLYDAVTLGVVHIVSEYNRTIAKTCRFLYLARKAVPVEYIVTEDQGT